MFGTRYESFIISSKLTTYLKQSALNWFPENRTPYYRDNILRHFSLAGLAVRHQNTRQQAKENFPFKLIIATDRIVFSMNCHKKVYLVPVKSVIAQSLVVNQIRILRSFQVFSVGELSTNIICEDKACGIVLDVFGMIYH